MLPGFYTFHTHTHTHIKKKMGNLTQIWQITTCCQFVSRACLDIFLFYLINNDTANTTISYWSVPIQRIQINLVHREDPSKDQLNIVSCLLPVCAVIDQDFCTVKHCISKLVQKSDIKAIFPLLPICPMIHVHLW